MDIPSATSKRFVPYLDLEAPERIPLHRIRWFILPLAAVHFSVSGASPSALLTVWAIVAAIYIGLTDILWKVLSRSNICLLLVAILDTVLISVVVLASNSVETLFFLLYLVPVFYMTDYLHSRGSMYWALANATLYLVLGIAQVRIHSWTIDEALPPLLIRLVLFGIVASAWVRYRDKTTKLEEICESIGSGLSIIDLKWRILFVNRIQRRNFPNLNLGGICYEEYNSPSQSTPCSWCPVLKARKSGKAEREITHSPDPDNPSRIRHYDVIATPIKDKRENIVAVIEIVNDITDSIELQYLETPVEDLLENTEAIRMLIDITKMIKADGCAIIVFDLGGENATVKQVFPRDRKSLDTVDIRIESFPALSRLHKQKEPVYIETLRAEEESVPTCIVSTARAHNLRTALLVPVMLGDKLWASALLEWRGKKKLTQAEIRAYRNAVSAVEMLLNRMLIANQLQEVSKAKEQIISALRHEMLSPMAKVSQLIQSAIDEKHDLEKLERRLLHLKKLSQRASNIFSKVVTASRLEKGTLFLSVDGVDIFDLISDVKSDLATLSEESGVAVSVINHTDRETLTIKADKDLFYEVIANLLTNAIEYNDAGGRVNVYIEQTDQDVFIKVADKGIGMSPEEQKRVFEEGYRADKAKAKRANGSGLGLFIVRGIVNAHGWDVSVNSKGIGKGSCFTIKIPMRGGEDAP